MQQQSPITREMSSRLLRMPEDALVRVQLAIESGRGLAIFMGASKSTLALVMRSKETLLQRQGFQRRLTLKELDRRQRALMFEDFRPGWDSSRGWKRGPHIDTAYSAREVSALEGDRAGERLEPYISYVLVRAYRVPKEVPVMAPLAPTTVGDLGPLEVPSEPIVAHVENIVAHVEATENNVTPDDGGFREENGDGLYQCYDATRGIVMYVHRNDLVPRFQPESDRCAVLRGGEQMNFNGFHHKFTQRIKPAKVSFKFLQTTTAETRGYTNFYLSSAKDPYPTTPTFWLSSPPEPADVFSFMVNVQDREDGVHLAWLPSGESVEFTVTGPQLREDKSDCWHQVEMYFDYQLWKVSIMLDDHLPTDDEGRGDKRFVHRDVDPAVMINGFSHLYLFTWLEDGSEVEPETCITDIWFEDTIGEGHTIPPPLETESDEDDWVYRDYTIPCTPANLLVTFTDAEEPPGD